MCKSGVDPPYPYGTSKIRTRAPSQRHPSRIAHLTCHAQLGQSLAACIIAALYISHILLRVYPDTYYTYIHTLRYIRWIETSIHT